MLDKCTKKFEISQKNLFWQENNTWMREIEEKSTENTGDFAGFVWG